MMRRVILRSCPFVVLAAATFVWPPRPGPVTSLLAETATSQVPPKHGPIELDQLKAKLLAQRAKIKSLYVEYRFETKAFVDPKLLPRWQMLEIHPYKAEERVGFRDSQRYLHESFPMVFASSHPPIRSNQTRPPRRS